MRLVRELEDAGAAAVQIEDQVLPKKCGHLSDKRLVAPGGDGAEGRRPPPGRRATSGSSPGPTRVEQEGLDKAIARARLYREAGAHVIFPEALRTADELRAFVRRPSRVRSSPT